MSRRAVTLLVASLLAGGLAVVGARLPVPYVAIEPGPAYDTLGTTTDGKPLIFISGHPTYPTSGHLDLVTISIAGSPAHPLDLASALRGWLDHRLAVIPREEIFPPHTSADQVQRQDAAQMQESQENATAAALRQLGVPVRTTVRVQAVQPGTPAAGRLRTGDVLTTVDRAAVTDVAGLRRLVGRRRPGANVTLGVRRGSTVKSVTLRTVAAPDDPRRPIIGVELAESHAYPFTVRIQLRDVGGPSAGLMFALGIIDKLTPGDLSGGRTIAGTGSIDGDGAVGAIGGIQQKIFAVESRGATIFLVPEGNCAQARQAASTRLRLVKVHALGDALASLQALRTGSGPVPSC